MGAQMAYYDEITMLRLGLGRWAREPVEERRKGRPESRCAEERQDAPKPEVERGGERD